MLTYIDEHGKEHKCQEALTVTVTLSASEVIGGIDSQITMRRVVLKATGGCSMLELEIRKISPNSNVYLIKSDLHFCFVKYLGQWKYKVGLCGTLGRFPFCLLEDCGVSYMTQMDRTYFYYADKKRRVRTSSYYCVNWK